MQLSGQTEMTVTQETMQRMVQAWLERHTCGLNSTVTWVSETKGGFTIMLDERAKPKDEA